MAYPVYDNYARSLSRVPSLGYGMASNAYPRQSLYNDGFIPMSDYPQPSYQIYGPPASSAVPVSHRLTGTVYDDLDVRDPYYADDLVAPGQMAMVPYAGMSMPRRRRHSTVSFASRPLPLDAYRPPSSLHIKFKRKGAFTAGISLAEAQEHIRLSGNEAYRAYEMHADSRNRILLRVRWSAYPAMSYEIPLDGYDGRVSLQTLARRVARACVHYLQANAIPVHWDRIQLHHLEEITYGVWQPMLSMR